MGQAAASPDPVPSHRMHHQSKRKVVFGGVCWAFSVACLLYQRSVGSRLTIIFRGICRVFLFTCQLPWLQGARAGEHSGGRPVELQAPRPPAAAARGCGQPAEGQVRRRQQQACCPCAASPILLTQCAEAALHLVEAAPFGRKKPPFTLITREAIAALQPIQMALQSSFQPYPINGDLQTSCTASCASARPCTERAMSMQGSPAQGVHQAAPRVHCVYGRRACSAGADA